MTGEPRCLWELEAELGEGPVWADDALWFVDIKKQKIHRLDPGSGTRDSWDAPEQIGFLLPTSGGGFVAGLKSGLHRWEPGDGGFDPIVRVELELPGNRLNDGTVDGSGRIWFGTMDNGEKENTGRIYRFNDGQLSDAGLPPVCITNGPALSPDSRTLYWVDTLGRAIHASTVGEDGSLSGSRLLIMIDEADGYPDGLTVDSEGCIWVGLFFGWEARRYSPSGDLLERVRFPVSNVTKLAFGGDDLRTVYATTARQGLAPGKLQEQPLAGAVFAFRADVPGLPAPRAQI